MRKQLLSLVTVSAMALAMGCAHSSTATGSAAVTSTPAPVVAVQDASAPVAETPAPAPEVAEAPEEETLPTTFSGEGWEISVPEPGWHRLQSPDDQHLVGLLNPDKRNLVIFVVEESKRTPTAQRDFIINHLLKESSSATVVASSKRNVKNNGITFAFVRLGNKIPGNPTKGWLWATVHNGQSFNLLCSGAEDDDKTQETACQSIFESLKITNGQ